MRSDVEGLILDLSLLEERLREPLQPEDLEAGWNDDAVALVSRMLGEAKTQLVTDRTGAKWARDSSLGRTLDMRWGISGGELLTQVLRIGLRVSQFPKSRLWRSR